MLWIEGSRAEEDRVLRVWMFDDACEPVSPDVPGYPLADGSRRLAAAMGGDGGFVAAWTAPGDDGTRVVAMRFLPDGSLSGSEFHVGEGVITFWDNTDVAMAPDGRFVIVWTRDTGVGDAGDVFFRLYGSDGTPHGPETCANETAASSRKHVSVGISDDGGFVVAWDDFGRHGELFGVVARRFGPDGSPVGAEFVVNTHTRSDHFHPSVAVAPDGRFVVAWTGDALDGSFYGVLAQRFDASGRPLGSLPWW